MRSVFLVRGGIRVSQIFFSLFNLIRIMQTGQTEQTRQTRS